MVCSIRLRSRATSSSLGYSVEVAEMGESVPSDELNALIAAVEVPILDPFSLTDLLFGKHSCWRF